MEVTNLVNNKLLQYLSNEISKENLYKWALDVLHNMLTGDIFKITYLKMWGIITELTTINDMDDACCDELVHRLNRILSGKECASFTSAFQIPEKFVLKDLLGIENILQIYLQEKRLSETDILELKLAVDKKRDTYETLNELLKMQIMELINLGYEFGDEEDSVEFSLKSTVFISESVSVSLENDLLKKVISLLECYNGRKCFYVHTVFNNGIGSILIQA